MLSILTCIRSLHQDSLLSRIALHKFGSLQYLQRYVHKYTGFQPLFRKILIANRGEIACRIIKTCRNMGIKTVSIFSSIDSQSLHVRLADESWCIGSHSSYLDMSEILHAALSTHSQAIHPGYGFLSENYKFVELLEANNIIFIGPGSKAIKLMGDKIQSKQLARQANVNTIPGYLGTISDESHALEIASEIGYPVMIKASAGGGGKGMRITDNHQQLKENYLLAKSEAQSSFGDNRLLIEKYFHNSRHIEIQILADKFGNTISLNERECSIQRRNQKIIEEAPSTFCNTEMRNALSSQAISLAKSVNYESAGTVEFLVDENNNFYFLEMNTRLQVEHAITEFITGYDIVEEMLNISIGKQLSLAEVPVLGWSIECRIYAEDPSNFLPSIGRITHQIIPDLHDGVSRFDNGVSVGTEITIHYDPLLNKIITFGKNREEAISSMLLTLDKYIILGVKTNIPFLYSVLSSSRFRSGYTHTNFIKEEYPNGFNTLPLNETDVYFLNVCASVVYIRRNTMYGVNYNSHIFPFSNDGEHEWTLNINLSQKINSAVKVRRILDSSFIFTDSLDSGSEIQILWEYFEPFIQIKMGNSNNTLQFLLINDEDIHIGYQGNNYKLNVLSADQQSYSIYIQPKNEEANLLFLHSPMSGKVQDVLVCSGEQVKKGENILIIEAMKMQNILTSPIDGKIKSINFPCGANVIEGDCIVEYFD